MRKLAGAPVLNLSSPMLFHSDSTDRRPHGIVIHALHKSATMFLYQLANKLCRDQRIPFYSANHQSPNDHLVLPNIRHDFCLGPIRFFELKPFADFPNSDICRIYHVRDPRDVLVSQYYSLGWLHTEKNFNSEESERREFIRRRSIDEYVLDNEQVLHTLVYQYRQLLNRGLGPHDRIVTYEQMVTDFDGWLARFIEPFEFRFPRWVRTRYAFRYRNEFQPDVCSRGHKRNVIPGDYRNRLKPDTIVELNRRLGPVLDGLAKLADKPLKARPRSQRQSA